MFVGYRAAITTKAGEIRNNLLTIRKETGRFETDNLTDVELYTIGAPQVLIFSHLITGELPGTIAYLLEIDVPPGLLQGRYDFFIDIEIKGKDYGTHVRKYNELSETDNFLLPFPSGVAILGYICWVKDKL